jgi:hypothetical protein
MSIASCNTCNGAGCFTDGTKCDDCGGVGCFPIHAERPSDAEGEKLEPVAGNAHVAALCELHRRLLAFLAKGQGYNVIDDGDLATWAEDILDAAMELDRAVKAADAIASLTAQLRAWQASHRWNIEEHDGVLVVCRGGHEKAEGCEYERYVPAEPTEAMVEAAARAMSVLAGLDPDSEAAGTGQPKWRLFHEAQARAALRASLQPSPTKTGVADGQ